MLRLNEGPTRSVSRRLRPFVTGLVTAAAVASLLPSQAAAIPSFARSYEVSCSHCHVIPPKLNEVGERFVDAGYRLAELEARPTVPASLWVSGRAESRRVDGDRELIDPYLNRVELISGGQIQPWLSYFIEWRLLSQESQGDGSLRDRSGRFEDAFLVASPGERLALTLGQFRAVDQVDVSRRLSLREPLALSASLPGEPASTPRRSSLRAFSPAGRSPGLRLAWTDHLGGDRRWTASLTVPMPGELSIPLNSEARREASNEIELRAKGVVLEGFVQRGVTSYGGHLFYDSANRYLLNGVVAGSRGPFHWTVVAGFDEVDATRRSRWSLEGEYLRGPRWGIGARLEDRSRDGAEPALLPYATWHRHLPRPLPARLAVTLEQRVQEERNATLLEVGLFF
ncbi:MAG TPA: hypothetical protein VM617_01370 [Thermoanaerobaculia bacterium]|nr:hypothetical protein [Thermoanaerobaculia bacterium]